MVSKSDHQLNKKTLWPKPTCPEIEFDIPNPLSGWCGVVIVGEAPGKSEIKQRKPFVGESGLFLNEALTEVGLARSTCLVANVFRFRPPKNKVSAFFLSRRRARSLDADISEEYGAFRKSEKTEVWIRSEFTGEIAYLKNTIIERQPNLIICLGGTALWALTGASRISERAGQPLICQFLPKVQVLPIFHPSFVLRSTRKRRPIWIENLRIAKRLLDTSRGKLVSGEHKGQHAKPS